MDPCGLYNTSFWNWFLLFTYTVMLQEEILRQLVCMKSCKFVRWATYRLVQDLFHHPYHLPTSQTVQPCSAHPIVQVVHRRAIFSMTVAWVTSVECRSFLCYSRYPLAHLAKVLLSPTNIPKASRKVGPITSSKWAEMGSPQKIAYSLATWATHWHPRSGTLT